MVQCGSRTLGKKKFQKIYQADWYIFQKLSELLNFLFILKMRPERNFETPVLDISCNFIKT